jgi:hypothetical protein
MSGILAFDPRKSDHGKSPKAPKLPKVTPSADRPALGALATLGDPLRVESRCHVCGAVPKVGELGGFGLKGWRCTRCQLAAGMPVDEPVPGPIGECPRCGYTSPLTPDGQCVPCASGRPPPEPWPHEPWPPDTSPRGILLAELKQMARRHQARRLKHPELPEGIDEPDLRSAFICTWHHQRVEQGQTKLAPQQFTHAFNEALEGHHRIVRLDDGRLLPAEEQRHG